MGFGSDYQKAYQLQSKFGDSILDPESYAAFKGLKPAAMVAGRISGDFVNDSTRRVYWRFNHPLAITNEVGRWIGRQAGLGKTYDKPRFGSERVLKPGVYDTPRTAAYGFLLANAMDLMSGNFNLGNLGQGGRPAGYQAVLPSDTDSRETTNMPLEFVSRYILGRTGRLLPWNEFQKERPNVTREQYDSYREYLSGKDSPQLLGLETVPQPVGAIAGALVGGLVGKKRGALYGAIAGTALTGDSAKFIADQGVLKGTWNGIDGPEIRMLGYRLPFSAIAGTAVAGAGMYALGKRYTHGDPKMREIVERFKPRSDFEKKEQEIKKRGAQWNPSPHSGKVGK